MTTPREATPPLTAEELSNIRATLRQEGPEAFSYRVDRWLSTLDAANPAPAGLREAAETLCKFAGRYIAGDSDVQHYHLQAAIDDVRAAVLIAANPAPVGLDVERELREALAGICRQDLRDDFPDGGDIILRWPGNRADWERARLILDALARLTSASAGEEQG